MYTSVLSSSYPFMFSTQPCFKDGFQGKSFSVSNPESFCRLGIFAVVPTGSWAPEQKCCSWMFHIVNFVLFQQWRYQEIWVRIWAEGHSFFQSIKSSRVFFEMGQLTFDTEASIPFLSVEFMFLHFLDFCRFLKINVMLDRNTLNCETQRWTERNVK